MNTQTASNDANPAPPPADPDAERYAALAKELEIEEQDGGEAEPQAEPAEPPADPQAEPADPSAEPKPAPTELDNARAALRESREALKAEQARTDAILAALQEARERRSKQEVDPAKAEPPKLPDVQEDPIGFMQAKFAQLEEALRHTHQGGQQQTQQIQEQMQEQALWSTVQASEAAIRDSKADYDDACRYLESARVRQLDRMYPSDSPHVHALARQYGFPDPNQYKLSLLNQDRRTVAEHALRTGIDAAQLYYDLAVDSGYQPKANGKAAPAAPLADRAAQQIAAAKKGTKAAVTLSGDTGGRKGANDMSIADLAELFLEDPDAADKVWAEMARLGKLG